MPGNAQATLFISNLDERVDERLLYEVMLQAGPLVDVYIPRDKETKTHKGYGFVEYSTEESAQYALSLFSGLVSLYKRSLRFAISGGNKSSNLGGDKLSQALESLNGSMNKTRDSSKVSVQQHNIIDHDRPKASIQQHVYPSYNHAQEAVYDIQSGGGFSAPQSVLRNMAYAQNYNSQLSMLSRQGLRTQSYYEHPHPRLSY